MKNFSEKENKMVLNQFNVTVTPESEAQVIQHIKDADGLLVFLQDLSPEDRMRQAKMALSRQDFIDKTLIHAEQNPGILPQYTDFESLRKDVELIKCLERIHAQVKPFNEKMQDTIMLVRSEAYEVARAFYSAVKEAARHGVPGMEHILKDLSYHFKFRNSSTSESTTTSTAASNQQKGKKKKSVKTGINGNVNNTVNTENSDNIN